MLSYQYSTHSFDVYSIQTFFLSNLFPTILSPVFPSPNTNINFNFLVFFASCEKLMQCSNDFPKLRCLVYSLYTTYPIKKSLLVIVAAIVGLPFKLGSSLNFWLSNIKNCFKKLYAEKPHAKNLFLQTLNVFKNVERFSMPAKARKILDKLDKSPSSKLTPLKSSFLSP